jgi:hypothetical protein
VSQTNLIDWLLTAETPSIRYLTARNLLNLPDNHPQVQAAQQDIMTIGAVPAIFAKQTTTGQWTNEHSYYTPKYVSTHWSLLLLTELCVEPTDARFQQGIEYMLTATAKQIRELLENNGHGFSCFWGNLLRYALYAKRADDARVQAIIEYAIHDITNGWCNCRYNNNLSCAWGVVRTLWGLAALPPDKRNSEIQSAIDKGISFLLETFSLVEADYPTPKNGKIHPLWFKLNFPLFYQTDILFTLRVLAELGALDHPYATPALDWLEIQCLPDGRWHGTSPYRQRTWRELGDRVETSRWVTLQAAIVLQTASRLDDIGFVADIAHR